MDLALNNQQRLICHQTNQPASAEGYECPRSNTKQSDRDVYGIHMFLASINPKHNILEISDQNRIIQSAGSVEYTDCHSA